MCLIAVAVFDTVENKRSALTKKTLVSLLNTVDFDRHELGICDNASCEETLQIYNWLQEYWDGVYPKEHLHLCFNTKNEGTAKAINAIWKLRKPKTHVVKIDNDVMIYTPDWADLLEDAIERLPDRIGICCAKRKDLDERPDAVGWAKSELKLLPQEKGQRNLVIEIVSHAMGTLQLYNWRLIDKIGGLTQMDGLYGFDDSLAGIRADVSGFISCFLHGIEIDHMDIDGSEDYTKWKQKYAGDNMTLFNQWRDEYKNGTRNIHEPL